MEAKILSRQIEGAQKKVEEQNFVMRKNVLKYDDVLNRHRGRIYEQRRQVLDGDDMSEQVKLWIDDLIEDTVNMFTEGAYSEEWDIEALTNAVAAIYPTEITAQELREDLGADVTREALVEEFQTDARDEYEAKEEQFGSELMRELERFVILQVVDVRWREHLENMDYLREGVRPARSSRRRIRSSSTRRRARRCSPSSDARSAARSCCTSSTRSSRRRTQRSSSSRTRTAGTSSTSTRTPQGAQAIAQAGGAAVAPAGGATQTIQASPHEKLGRNEPCWCGSGKKFKKCHGA